MEKNIFEAVKAAYKGLDDKLAIDIKVLDISELSPIADYFVIASGSNSNQIKAMADSVEEALYKAGFRLNHSEGMQTGSWILLDFGDIIVHLFNEEDRGFYSLERIWGDAKEVSSDELK
ncbi:MAG: ribosome silencing factor [Firmicutes bacterium]|nr:ribosome silencing factor [Bacillota bacterium]